MTRDCAIPLNRSGGTLDGGHVPRGSSVLESRVIRVSNRSISFKINRATQVHIKIDVKVSHHPSLVLGLEECHIVLPSHIVHVHRRRGRFCSLRFRGRLLWLFFRGDCRSIRGLVFWRRGSVHVCGGTIALLRCILRLPCGICGGTRLGRTTVNGRVGS